MRNLALALALASSSGAPVAASAGPGIARRVPWPGATNRTPRPHRLTMKVTLIDTGDSHEGPGNTEDEIYFALAGMTKLAGVESVRIRRTVRPQIARDFWEMGAYSADEFRVNVFEGALAADDTAVFAVLIGEQDNQSLASLIAAFTLAATALIERMAVDLAVGQQTSQSAMDGLSTEVHKLAAQMSSSGDELMGAVEVLVRGGRLTVRTSASTSSSLVSATNATAAVQIDGGGGKYRLDFALEDPARDRPQTQTFLSREQDRCDQPNLYVDERGGGTVTVKKGDGGVPVRVEDDVFHWHCGSMAEDGETNAPNDTRMVEVTRAASGGTIHWDCYHEQAASPQYTW